MTTTTAGLDADAIVAAAREQTGLTDLGDDAILEGLNVLVDAINREAKLTEAAQGRWAQQLTATLANRLQVEDYLAKHPALLDAPVVKPLFVFGLPRTGTTLTINLLNADPARRSFLRWEAFNTVPPAAAGALSSDPRYVAEQARLDMMLKYAPHISAMHHEDADSPTECQFSMAPSFCAQYYDSVLNIPSYQNWLFSTSYLPAFRYQKRLFQLLQENNGGQWTLKNPWHPLFLNDLTTIYPDAQLVMTHRDPADVVASACSLVYQVRKMFSDDVDPVEVGRSQLRTFDLMIERMLAYRAAHGWDAIHDIQYDQQLADPIGEMRRLYARFDTPLTAEAEAAMQATLSANPQGKHGKHSYALEDYGFDRAGIHAHFEDYIDRFAIPVKG
ncbi:MULTISPECIES: sulfotransferase family protein [unclassified Sphingobium]|uniref:sulfotransferase family protein n=1 Tax=unclassified Sphingobium TaxID=2611147 RepID=UPI0007F45241|nr:MULTISPECIES: sulfotransferase [unclassified Sphingobium]OAN59356.1 sulfotransferase [Sphingobium sp. TCM1]WIW90138.1 sulfotransferase [Sphingobium sp. V4]